ncbi:hypothetical protein M885DRAFT_550067 [Pelagophyceae sp. CCMP2097]|nr:hypothetical protein M885DRAFT_550067 [Pelagophyceae sp. CCMP2097]
MVDAALMEPAFRVAPDTGMHETVSGKFRLAFRFPVEAGPTPVRQRSEEFWAVPFEEQEALLACGVSNFSLFFCGDFAVGSFDYPEDSLSVAFDGLAATDAGEAFLWSFAVLARNGQRLDACAEELEPLAYVGADRDLPPERTMFCFARPEDAVTAALRLEALAAPAPCKWTGDVRDRRGRLRRALVTAPRAGAQLDDLVVLSPVVQRQLQAAGFWDLSLFALEGRLYGFCSADDDVDKLWERFCLMRESYGEDATSFFEASPPAELERCCYVGADRLKLHVAVVGCGWWAQGWHLPHLAAHAETVLAAVVEPAEGAPFSALATLEARADLAARYDCPSFATFEGLLDSYAAGDVRVDAVVIAAPHAAHRALAERAIDAGLHVFCEKPLCTTPADADAVEAKAAARPDLVFMVNHTANFRVRSILARELVVNSRMVGEVRHVSCEMHSPLSWLFEDARNAHYVLPAEGMAGNGFMWSQMSHSLAWAFWATDLEPMSVFARRVDSPAMGADLYDSVSVRCTNGAIIAVQGVATLPGQSPASSKLVRNFITGTDGFVSYSGDDGAFDSGALVLRRHAPLARAVRGLDERKWRELGFEVDGDGCGLRMHGFDFEDGEAAGCGPASLQAFVDAAFGRPHVNCADARIAALACCVVDAAYHSCASGRDEPVRRGAAQPAPQPTPQPQPPAAASKAPPAAAAPARTWGAAKTPAAAKATAVHIDRYPGLKVDTCPLPV